ncbi:MAG TPA: hypothetical protein PKC18_20415, partial [Lacipirellulaceae bacterium]|nr:hypothetical protein [Lacipirellulaceae bacterium]
SYRPKSQPSGMTEISVLQPGLGEPLPLFPEIKSVGLSQLANDAEIANLMEIAGKTLRNSWRRDLTPKPKVSGSSPLADSCCRFLPGKNLSHRPTFGSAAFSAPAVLEMPFCSLWRHVRCLGSSTSLVPVPT